MLAPLAYMSGKDMMTTTNNNLQAILIDPEDQGFYKSRMQQWSTLCPHMNATEHRVFSLLLDLCTARTHYRWLTLTDLAAMLPTKAVDLGEEPKLMSVSTIARSINALSAIGQVTDENGNPLRLSNGKGGQIRIAPWRSLRHDCSASRNAHDALARAQGGTGDEGPRHPAGLEGHQPNLVGHQPNLVEDQPNLVGKSPNLVEGNSDKPASTSQNTASPEASPNPPLKVSSPPPQRGAVRAKPPVDSSARPKGRGGVASQKGRGSIDSLDHSAVAVELIAELPAKTGIETAKVVDAITRKLNQGHVLQDVRTALLRELPRKVGDLTGLYLSRLHKLGADEDGDQEPVAAVRPDAHVFVSNTYGECTTCGLAEANARHRIAVAPAV